MATKKITALDVLKVAYERLFVEGRFTKLDYQNTAKNARGDSTEVMSKARSHCAVGGVEHAIWKLTGENPLAIRQDVYRTELFALTMTALDAMADRVAKTHGIFVQAGVEGLTFYRDGKKLARECFELAIAEEKKTRR